MKIFHAETYFHKRFVQIHNTVCSKVSFSIINYFKSHTVSFVASQNRNDRLKAVAGKSSVLSVVQLNFYPRYVVYSLYIVVYKSNFDWSLLTAWYLHNFLSNFMPDQKMNFWTLAAYFEDFWKINIDYYKWWHNLSIDVCQLFFLLTYLYIIWDSETCPMVFWCILFHIFVFCTRLKTFSRESNLHQTILSNLINAED